MRALAAPLAVAVVVRLGTWWLVGATGAWPTQGDASSYVRASQNLVAAGTYSYGDVPSFEPTAYRPPGYPFFLALLRPLAQTPWLVRVAQLLLSLLTLVLLTRLVAALEPGLAPWVAWLTALSPFDGVYTAVLLSETLTTFLLVASACAFVLAPARWRLAAGGACLGLTCLVRDQYLAFIPFAALAWLGLGPGVRKERLRDVVVAGLACAAVILPWTARNAVHFHKLIPVSAGRLGSSLWMGSWALDGEFTKSDVTGVREYPDVAFLRPEDRVLLAQTPEAEQDALFRRWFGERLRAEPVAVVGRWVRRAPRLWLGTRFDIFELRPSVFPAGSATWTAAKVALYGLNFLQIAAALVGLVLAVRGGRAVRWLALPVAFTAALFLPLNSFENRYSQPVLPFVVVLGALAVRALLERVRQRRAGAVAAPHAGRPEVAP